MINFIKRYILIIFLSFLVIVLIVLKLIYGNNEQESPVITPTPTIEPTGYIPNDVPYLKELEDPSDSL